MQLSEAWLKEWLDLHITKDELIEKLAMAGHELDEATPVANDFNGVVVGEVLNIEAHPNADKLRICTVNVGQEHPLSIVCGAKNVAAQMKVPVALEGAKLSADFVIKKSKLRGVESCGMICSESELGLAETSEGIMPLPADAPIGKDFREYLKLNDTALRFDLTPNRGDCLSVEGLARELSVLTNTVFKPQAIREIKPTAPDVLSVALKADTICHHYVGRVLRNINNKAQTPLWMKERLRRSGLRAINPVVDVTNYVLLELGQPLHAFDLDKINKNIVVRMAKPQESLVLLDGKTLTLTEDTLVIADEEKALALAGIMGGEYSAVKEETTDIFLESAFFTPEYSVGKARQYGLHTDSSHRYERGVDIKLQRRALERATELLQSIVGGDAGPLVEEFAKHYQENPKKILLRREQIKRILGIAIKDENIQSILQGLGMTLTSSENGWQVIVPSHRFDISIEVDLIEEVGRIYGYNRIPDNYPTGQLRLPTLTEKQISLGRIKKAFADRAYREIISYSFVEPKLQNALSIETFSYGLQNPISPDMAHMRTSLWPGLIKTLQYNQNRQQNRLRFFEVGVVFLQREGKTVEVPRIAGLIQGNVNAAQWGMTDRKVDFFDLKGDLDAVLSLCGKNDGVTYAPCYYKSLHPGQSAQILYKGESLGFLGKLHPETQQVLDIKGEIFLFEMDLMPLTTTNVPKFAKLSKYPVINRDIALVVPENLPASDILTTLKEKGGETLLDVTIFDVYKGKGIPENCKSLAISLLLQHQDRTLVDEEVNEIVNKLLTTLKNTFGATLRE